MGLQTDMRQVFFHGLASPLGDMICVCQKCKAGPRCCCSFENFLGLACVPKPRRFSGILFVFFASGLLLHYYSAIKKYILFPRGH